MENEKRLIYLEDAKEALTGWDTDPTDEEIEWTLDQLPKVDAVEVVHGHMVERIVDHECPWYTVYDCSECGCSIERWHNYCPNCGAKMDGDRNV